ncbi:unnamed protein product [Rotaria socialis]|uniref:Uncharacterized protein n=1 Tax=Rotaria socialis TaxID=392032 RepID=A0A817LFJ5_9BILA|nr:unnamed protein product [Rotaria socialis]CAF3207210.1 unnamed protein product [Rotaria socialis]CAF3463736.1 unnamed protein product [Rotaria socialis]CAF4170024.1 unnamed protein product [Rotaria socialis]CAF4268914.1 unnamed protein product [Rotaria socialis]
MADEVSFSQRNAMKLIIIGFLTIVAIGTSVTLAAVLIKQSQRHRTSLEKKNMWSTRLKECSPILKVAGPIILQIIKVATSIILL